MAPDDSQKAISNPTLGAEVSVLLQQEILSGTFPPGAPLREVPLSERYGASRQTIREALRSLADLGLVELLARRGARIPSLSPRRAREIYTLRALLEPFALRTALVEGRIRSQEMERIEAAFNEMVRCAERNDVAALVEADMAFHWELCSPCAHGMLLDYLKRLQNATRQSMVHMKVYGSDAEGEVESHSPIMHAVRARDADGAASAMRDHISAHGERLLIKLLEEAES
jgi:DNA-binding GntR family transcriptional regulator